MAKARMASGLLAGCLLLWGGAGPALAQPSVAQMLQYKPRQQDVVYSTPSPEEQAGCKVTLEPGTRPGSSWLVLLDAQGRKLRGFFGNNGKGVEIWSYYKDGAEVYREADTNQDGVADQYRWLNTGGMKWGVDVNADGKIDAWRMISAEEVAHEVFLATATQDFNRLRVLFITEDELRALKLPAARMEKIQKQLTGASAKFAETIKKLPALTSKANFVRAESAVPQCRPADTAGAEQDLIRFADRVVLYEGSDKKHEWLHTGGMIQIGLAWRLLDAPSAEEPTPVDGGKQAEGDAGVDPELVRQLTELDKGSVPPIGNGPNPQAAAFYKKRLEIVERINAAAKNKEPWVRQLADNYSNLAQCGSAAEEASTQQRLAQLLAEVKAAKATSLVPYVAFREMWSRYAKKITQPNDNLQKYQEEWLGLLTKFVQEYGQAEDAPDALMQLGMGREFGKEDEAKRWYQQLVSNFPKHQLAPKAQGCIRRLELVGRPLELAAATVTGQQYNIASVRGKVVVVYYWNKDCGTCIGDFARLKQLLTTYAAKGLEVVGVSLDDRIEDAKQFLQSNPLPVPHLFQGEGQATGLSGPLAIQYGVMTMPNIFLVGKDGNVISRTLQMNDLEDAIKKAL
jgi:peroxiredoxin